MFNDIKCFFKDFIAKIKNKRFSTKTLSFILVAVVVLLIPALTAIWHVYFRAADDFGGSSDITISFHDLKQDKELFFEEINEKNISDSHIANMFYSLNSGKELLNAPDEAPKEPNFKIHITAENNSVQYLCYFSERSSDSYLSDESGKMYSVNEKSYTSFLTSAYSANAYSKSVPPALLTAIGAKITPSTVSWHFRKANGVFASPDNIVTTDEKKIYQMHETIALSFSVQPSKCNVTVFEHSESNAEETEIYSGDLSGLSTITINSDAKLIFLVEASWHQSEYKEFYGNISYAFEVNCIDHASFEISSSTVSPGEFVTILLHETTDASPVKYELLQSNETPNNIFTVYTQSELSDDQKEAIDFLKGFKPVFVSDDQNLYAFLPIPFDTPKGSLSFSISSGIATKTFTLEITEKAAKDPITLDASFANISDIISKDSVSETKTAFDTVTEDRLSTLLFSTSFTSPLKEQSTPSYKFGGAFTADELQTNGLCSYGNFYSAPDNTFGAVTPVSVGKVAYVGYTKQLGNFVVVDHGMGLCSWYCNLSFVDVRQGDVLAEGQLIGKTGNSTISEDNGVLFICTIYGCLIDPDLIINKQITLNK